MPKWSQEDKLRALALAQASSAGEASKQTGIPRGTILTWMRAVNQSDQSTNQSTLPKTVRDVAKEAVESAKAEVRDYIVDQVRQWSSSMMEMSIEAAKQAMVAVQHKPADDTSTADWARWLHALVGAMDYGVKNHQLLEGKPTGRQEVVNSDGDQSTRESLQTVRDELAELRALRQQRSS